ncbi:hypothetical protein EV649_6259 [Kribbella sp. VKM Ac-2569]|uniref:hypothetical protein n=1 Tax=Kribbella sp. VKM Ac-2569 TaxID=2512220 RepID=UPI00102C2CF2|nr:hypothetical protein [Kribbella sp. VKM Ac-2569]RZT15466.1 hypothetical protein EV649_6259 [Kribbella sp. VKM Ac-2569]
MSQQNPASGRAVALLTAALAVLLVGVFMLASQLTHQQVRAASPEKTTLKPTRPKATAHEPAPSVTPSRNPRREADVDRGTPLGQGVFVEVANGWTTVHSFTNGLEVTSWDRGADATFSLSPRPMPSLPLMLPAAKAFADEQAIYGFQAGRARALPPPNGNILEAVSIGFTGRLRQDDVTYSLAGECVRLRGAPKTNDVSISVCWAAYVQDLGTVRAEVQRMIGSAARSI